MKKDPKIFLHHILESIMDVVWETSNKDLPKLKKQISEIVDLS